MYYIGLVIVAVYPVIDYTRTRPPGTGVPDDRVPRKNKKLKFFKKNLENKK